MEALNQEVAVVVVPFPAQGHLNQLLHFSLLLSSHGLPVHYICSAPHVRQAKQRVQGWDSNALQSITFHDLPLPPFSTPPPDPNTPTKFPAHLQPLFEATLHLQPPLASLLRSISSSTSRRLVVVHEPLMSFAGRDAASLPNTEIYSFHCVPAFDILPFIWLFTGKQADPGIQDLGVLNPSFEGCFTEEFLSFVGRHQHDTTVEVGHIINTSRPIEGEFIDLLAQEPLLRDKLIFAIGPLNPVEVDREGDGSGPRHECLEWLDKQPPNSVVFVSFGTTSSMSDEQIEELAIGLERSGQRFIWVLRDADRGDIFGEEGSSSQKLLSNYEEKVKDVGIIMREWAPQLEILAHPSTGAFMSHCGWNSCSESLSMGVPIVAWPMHSDQPRNAMMVTEKLKVGVTVRDWARRGEIVLGAAVEESIKRVMVYDEGKEMRKRAKALGEEMRKATMEGGTSRADLVSFIAHVTR